MKKTVLLVDDNPELLEVLTDELSGIYDVLTAPNGQEALEVLKKVEIQVIICDVMMPVMDGFEFCSIVKSNLEYSHFPVILLTAKNTLQSRIQGLDIGADAYIEKPFSIEHLTAQIANLISSRNKLRSYFANSPSVHIKCMAQTKSDELFLEKLNEIIQNNLNDQFLDIEKLSKLMNTSRSSLFRKIKAISDLTPNELINITRLKKAAQLLIETNYKIFEVAYMLGFNSQTSFGRSFVRQFGVTPTDYQKEKQG